METIFDSHDPKGIRFIACEGTVTALKRENFTGAEDYGYYSIASFGVSNGSREWLFSKVLIPQQLDITQNAKGYFYVAVAKDKDSNSALCGMSDEEGLAIEPFGLYNSTQAGLTGLEEIESKTYKMFKKMAALMLFASIISFGILSPLLFAVLIFWGIAKLTFRKIMKRARSVINEIPKPDALSTLIQSHHELRTHKPAVLKPMRQISRV